MSVIVNGMKMPNSCTMCWLNTFCGVWNVEPVKHKGFNERLEDCPLTELIQCKDCKHYDDDQCDRYADETLGYEHSTQAYGYCWLAERKEE